MKQFSFLKNIKALLPKTLMLLIPFFLLTGHVSFSQCNFASSFGTATINPTGGVVTISTCSFAGEYSTINGATNVMTLRFTSSVATDWITVRSGTPGGAVLAFGQTPLVFANTFNGTVYAHWSTNNACGTQNACRTTTVQCTVCAAPPPTPCLNSSSFGSAAIDPAGALSTISTCSFAGEYSTITGAVAGKTLQFTSSVATDFITVRSGSSNGPVLAFGTTPLSFSNTFTGTVYAHWNTPGCGSQASCRTTTVQCTSCFACLPVTITPPAATICAGSVQLLTASHANPPSEPATATTTNNTSVPILDLATVTSTTPVSNVPAGAVVTGLSVNFNINHTWDGDLIISLKSPNNQVLNLVNARGGSGDNFTNTTINSTSTTSLGTATPPFTGIFAPDANPVNPPVAFTQTTTTFPAMYPTPNGNWVMGIRDNAGGDVGTLLNWAITINYLAQAQPVWAPLTELFTDAAATIPYTGTPSASVYARPTSTRTYTATLATSACTPAPASVTITTNPAPVAPIITPNPTAVCPNTVRQLDATTAPGSTGSCTTSSGPISVIIPDNTPAGAISTLNVTCVPAGATVTGVDVTFNLNHTWDGDMIINLQAPNSQVLNLVNQRGGSGNDFINTVISSASSTSLGSGTPPFTGTFMADGNAANPPTAYPQTTSTFPPLYTTPNGTWTFAMRDNAAGDIGTLTSWSVLINYTIPPAPVAVVWAPNTELFTDAAATIPYAGTALSTIYVKPTAARNYSAVIPSVPCPSLPATVVVTLSPNPSIVIVADPGSTICEGDPTLLTVRLGTSTPIGTLYNQLTAPGDGSPSQVFEPVNTAFNSQSADDFTVPAGTTWTVTQVNALGFGAGTPTSVNVFFYNNSGSNLPGTVVASYPNLTTYTHPGGNYNVTLPAGLALGAGTYWVSIQVNMSFATSGQWFWGNFGTTNIGNQYAWQNPGGGFGTPCASWGYGATGCGVGGGVNRNNSFSIIGSSLADGGPLPGGYTFLWSPAAGLSSTTSNPVAASPNTTRTYTVTATTGAGCIQQASILITVNQRPTITTQPVSRTNCAGTTATFTVTGTGTNITYQWQESVSGPGGPWNNLSNLPPYSGVTTPTLTINPVTVAMNNNQYRCVLTGVCSPIGTANISNAAILTVNPLPVVTVTPTSGCGGVAGMFGTALTASGADSYTWAPLTGLFTDAAATIPYTGGNAATVYAAPTVFTAYTVTGTLSNTTGCSNTATAIINYTPPPPTVTPASVTMCLGDAAVKLKSSSSTTTTVNFASGPISVIIPDATLSGATSNITVSGIPAAATIASTRVTFNINHTWDGDIAIALKAPNGNILNLDYYLSNTGGTGATTGFVNTTISSAGGPALSSGTNPYTGTFRADAFPGTSVPPAGPTSITPNVTTWPPLYGTPNGTWTLGMVDAFAGDQGTLTSWSINMTYVVGVPATPATWSPVYGLFSDAGATTAYVAGTAVDSVWTKPTPDSVYTYQVTVQSLPPQSVFSNPGVVLIPGSGTSGPANPYPANIVVSGLPPTGVTVQSVTLTGITHTWESDISILLQSPSPANTNVILMSNQNGNEGGFGINNKTFTFSDAAATSLAAGVPSGTYRPTNRSTTRNWPAPGPGVVVQGLNPLLSTFTGNPNGTWKLYAFDAVGGDVGRLAGGYSINFNVSIAPCTSPPRNVVVTVNKPTTVTTQPVKQVICTDKVATFTVVAGGSGPFSYQWQESLDNGNTWSNITNGGVYSGATTATLTITAPPVTMSGNQYRVIITGAAPCAPAISFQALLTVNPLPTIVITASPYTSLFPGLVTRLSSTVSPVAAQSYTWLRNGTPVSGGTNATLDVNVDVLGDYQLRVTDINTCTNVSNIITIKDSASGKCFIYPNPTSGLFEVRYYSVANNVLPRSLTVYDSKGDRVFTKFYTIGRPYDRMPVDMRAYGKGLYWVEIGDLNGNRITMCRVVIQ